jgi:hypothetical protein
MLPACDDKLQVYASIPQGAKYMRKPARFVLEGSGPNIDAFYAQFHGSPSRLMHLPIKIYFTNGT